MGSVVRNTIKRSSNFVFSERSTSTAPLSRSVETKMSPKKVCIVGSGNWGSAIARLVGFNADRLQDKFVREVNMWVFEEMVEGRKLTEIINETHENVKYLPGKSLPTNIVAVPDIETAVTGADMLIFVLPHQFIKRVLSPLNGKLKPGTTDLITTCYGGRNRKVSQAFVERKKSIVELEGEMLNGQKLQGPETAAEVNYVLAARGLETDFPLFTAVHKICSGELSPDQLISCLRNHP